MDVLGKLALAPGAALAAAAAVAGAVRRDKALHPRGLLGRGHLAVEVPDAGLGVPLFSMAGEHEVEVRLSRAMGLPDALPDVEGLALRIMGAGTDGGPADLLFASTGSGRLTRFALTLRAADDHGPLSTLLPVQTRRGPLVLLAEAVTDAHPPRAWRLSGALGRGAWMPLARLEVDWAPGDVADRFDPVTRPLLGTEQYRVVQGLREPAYAAARAVSRARADRPVDRG